MAAAKKRIVPPRTYATWNPDDKYYTYNLSNNNKTITKAPGATGNTSARATLPKSSGKWYVEITDQSWWGTGTFGLADKDIDVLGTYPGAIAGSCLLADGGGPYYSTPFTQTTLYSGIIDQILMNNVGSFMLAVDCDNRKVWIGRGGEWFGADPATNTNQLFEWSTSLNLCLAARLYIAGEYQTWNFGEEPFEFEPPAGFNEGWNE